MSLKKLIYQGLVAGAARSFAYYSVVWTQGKGHWLPATASASDSEPVYGWRQAFVLLKELAGRNSKDTRPAEPGHYLQVTDTEKEIAESPKHVLDHHQMEL